MRVNFRPNLGPSALHATPALLLSLALRGPSKHCLLPPQLPCPALVPRCHDATFSSFSELALPLKFPTVLLMKLKLADLKAQHLRSSVDHHLKDLDFNHISG